MSLPKPLYSKPRHVKANTAIGKEKFSKFSAYAERFYNKHQYQQYISKIFNLSLGEGDVTY